MCEIKRMAGVVHIACGLLVLCADRGVGAVPPDPDNAALLYYQAFLLCPAIPNHTFDEWNAIIEGGDPNGEVRDCLKDARETIELAEIGAELPRCDWGTLYSKGITAPMPYLDEVRTFTIVLYIHARNLAWEGDCLGAFDRCMTIRRFARHVGDDALVPYALSTSVDLVAQGCIRHILEAMPPDEGILMWVRHLLETAEGPPPSPANALRSEFEITLQTIRADPAALEEIRLAFAENADTEGVQNLTDEELLDLAGGPGSQFQESAIQIIDSNMPYAAAYAEIERLQKEMENRYGADPVAGPLVSLCGWRTLVWYHLWVRRMASFNALKVGIEIYRLVAMTQQLPGALADDWPHDPLTDDVFAYEITEEGFMLSNRNDDIPRGGIDPIKFKLHQ